MSITVNKKYSLLTMLLFGGWVVTWQVDAKSTSSYTASKNANVSKQQLQNNNGTVFDIKDQSTSRPQINKIFFSGNTKISSEELKKAIPLNTKDMANENVIMASMIKIAQLYKAKNIKVTITPLIEKTGLNSTNIHFDIHEISIDKK